MARRPNDNDLPNRLMVGALAAGGIIGGFMLARRFFQSEEPAEEQQRVDLSTSSSFEPRTVELVSNMVEAGRVMQKLTR